jgi:hypothetical protein
MKIHAKKRTDRSKTISTPLDQKDKQTVVSSEALPRRTLEQSLRIAQVIRDTYAGKATSWAELAKALGVSEKNPVNRYPLWSATAYGIVIKGDDNAYSLAETGRKILAPTYEGEKEEGIKKALFTPSVLSRFYTDYNGSLLPSDDLFPNVLETRYGVPRDRTTEAIEILKENARFAGALVKRPDGKEALEFSDIAFPVVKRRTTSPTNGDHDGAVEEEASSESAAAHVDWKKICFVITPIGNEDSEERNTKASSRTSTRRARNSAGSSRQDC